MILENRHNFFIKESNFFEKVQKFSAPPPPKKIRLSGGASKIRGGGRPGGRPETSGGRWAPPSFLGGGRGLPCETLSFIDENGCY